MKPFFCRRRVRFIASTMLFAWLMVVGMSVANACLVQMDQAGHHHVSEVSAHFMDESDDASGNPACQTYCAAERTAAIKQKGVDADPANTMAQAGPVPAWPRLATPPSLMQSSIAAAESAWPVRPVFIRLHRLNL